MHLRLCYNQKGGNIYYCRGQVSHFNWKPILIFVDNIEPINSVQCWWRLICICKLMKLQTIIENAKQERSTNLTSILWLWWKHNLLWRGYLIVQPPKTSFTTDYGQAVWIAKIPKTAHQWISQSWKITVLMENFQNYTKHWQCGKLLPSRAL